MDQVLHRVLRHGNLYLSDDDEAAFLGGLRERAALLNGHLTVETRPGRGVRLTAEVPLHGSLRRSAE